MNCFKSKSSDDQDQEKAPKTQKSDAKKNGHVNNNEEVKKKSGKKGEKGGKDDIEKDLKKDKKKMMQTHRIPVVGAGESGKSTLIKQMQILFINGFTDEEKRAMIPSMRRNVRDGLLSITGAMSRIVPPVQLEHPEYQELVDYVQNVSSAVNFDYPAIFFEHAEKLWADKGVQESFSRSNEYQLIDCAKYFLDKCRQVGEDSFLPNEQDILRCRVLTSGIFETNFTMNKVNFHMFDVGGQREERRKWIQVFHDITAVIYVSANSAYDMTLREDASQNRVTESLELFETIWNNRFLRNNSVILFLNKQDLFSEKIKAGKSKLVTYFPDYANFPQPEDDGDDPEVNRAKCFMKAKFFAISERNNADPQRKCFSHFTTAVDTDNIRRVFADCQNILQRAYMAKFGLL